MQELAELGFGNMTIGGQVRGFHIGTYQSKLFCEVRGVKLSEYFEELSKFTFENSLTNNEWVCQMLYSALAAYDTFKGNQVDYTPEKVMFWADMTSLDEIAKLFVVMHTIDRNSPKKSDA